MPAFLRTLALVLALVSAVVPQLLEAVRSPPDCAEEEAACSDCTRPCECCTVRVATLSVLGQVTIGRAPELRVVPKLNEPVLTAVNPDIFHPPKT